MDSPTLLTSVYGAFRAHVVGARLESEGIGVELRGALDGPYALTVGDLARVDVYVPAAELESASLVLLADEADSALEPLHVSPRRARWPLWVVLTAMLVASLVPILRLVVTGP